MKQINIGKMNKKIFIISREEIEDDMGRLSNLSGEGNTMRH